MGWLSDTSVSIASAVIENSEQQETGWLVLSG
jgi:hypothetical protein